MTYRPRYGSDYERARRHIEAAERLRRELGGAEAQTRRTFLDLDYERLDALLEAYRLTYGESAYEYAIETFPRWRSGRRKMSGMVAERIFNLLPQFVTRPERHEIAGKLWKHLAPGSDMCLVLSTKSRPEDMRDALDRYARQHVRDYTFPETLHRRFTWIANQDVQLAQQLLNHFQQMEYRVAVDAVNQRVPVIARILTEMDGNLVGTATEEIRVGKHRLQIMIRGDAREEVRLEPRNVVDESAARHDQDEARYQAAQRQIAKLSKTNATRTAKTKTDDSSGCMFAIILIVGSTVLSSLLDGC